MRIMRLEERGIFENLLANYARAEAAMRTAEGLRHDALHACINYAQRLGDDATRPLPPDVRGYVDGAAADWVKGAEERVALNKASAKLESGAAETDLRSAGADTFTPKRYERAHKDGCRMDADHYGNCSPPEALVDAVI